MNIRDHVREAIRGGLEAEIAERDGAAGVIFTGPDEPAGGTWIPFGDLGYRRDLGYYELSKHPDAESETSNDNPIGVYEYETPPGDPWRAYWMDYGDEIFTLLGDRADIADIVDRLARFLADGETDGPPIAEFDPRLPGDRALTAREAASLAIEMGYDPERAADAIRRAAYDGRILGASKDEYGNWIYGRRGLTQWIRRSLDPGRPGRPTGYSP